MSDERHEKALEAAMQGSPVVSRFTLESAIATYLQAMDAVIVPKEPTEEMLKPEWGSIKADIYRDMLSRVPNHFTNGK